MRTLLLLSLIGALLGIGPGPAVDAAQAAGGCYVTASSATLRSAPSARSTALGVAYRGNRCKEKDWRGGWTKVAMTSGGAKGATGWVRDDLVHTAAEGVRTCIPEDVACHQ
ncbi:SH3 domain-containing protein [Streptomyces sp. NPDC048629]|uniref:SH3 domain-containing protein n=1 Tax=Streptomyces sp. NPDC048629 TaxID=3154824 RepID=UPI003421ABAD